jgi:hypothetical protein
MRELWKVMGGLKRAGAQTLQRRMMLQLGQLERDGCIRLDQVWSIPSQNEPLAATAGAIESLEQDLSRHPKDLLERALHLNEEIDEAIEVMRKKVTPTKSKKERSPSEESLELLGTERTKGDIFSMPVAQEEELVVVELFLGISATTETLLRAGVKINNLYCCELDPKARAVNKTRASDWVQVFPELLQPSALEGFHSFLPQNVELIGNSHILAMEKPDLIVAGFPCQGFSCASGQAVA